ncbi:MAG: DUF2339 domain-containing protein [Acidimicrobiia bacterium]
MSSESLLTDAVAMTTSPSKPELLSGRTLFRAGLALLVLATAFFLRYSIEQGWIGPIARVALAAGAGSLLIGAGMAVGRDRAAYGVLLQGTGAAVLFLTGYAAHHHYGLTSATEGFLQLAAVSALTLALARRSNSELLAGIGLGTAAAAPALIDGRMSVVGAESVYLATIGALSTVLFFRAGWWRSHTMAAGAIAVSVLVDLGAAVGVDGAAAVAVQTAMVIAWLMLVIVPLAATVTRLGPLVARRALPMVTTSVGSLALYAGTRLIFAESGTRISWTALALGLVAIHLLAARTLRDRAEWAVGRVQYVPAVTLTVAAVGEAMTGDWVLVGLAAVAVGLVVAGHKGVERRLADAGHVLYLLVAVMLVAVTAIVTGDAREPAQLLPGLLVLAAGAAIGVVARGTDDHDLSGVYLAGAYFGSMAWTAVELPRLGSDGLAWVTAAWAVLGVAAIVTGRLGESRPALSAGFAAVGLALGKLFFVDLAEASPLTRIALFAGVGLLLVGGGYWLGDWSIDRDAHQPHHAPDRTRS